MKTPISRRDFLKKSALAAGTGLTAPFWLPRAFADATSPVATSDYSIAPGPFQPSWESLEQNYHLPDWYPGCQVWHLGSLGRSASPVQGDWYAKYMYAQGRPQNRFHVEHFGPSIKIRIQHVINVMRRTNGIQPRSSNATNGAGANSSSRWTTTMTTWTCLIRSFSHGIRSVWVPKRILWGTWAALAARPVSVSA